MGSERESRVSGLVRASERGTRVATALVGVVLAVVAGYVGLFSGAGERVVSLSYDLPFLVHRANGGEELCLVYNDVFAEGFLDRKPQAALLDRLTEAGAKAVVYDVCFDQPSSDPGVDEAFAAAMRRFRGVDESGEAIDGEVQRTIILGALWDSEHLSGAIVGTLIPATDVLFDAADGFGVLAYPRDDAARKLSTGTVDEASLTWAAAVALGVELDEERRLDERWINYVGPPAGDGGTPAIASIRAASLLEGAMHPGLLRDKIVLVGGAPEIAGTAPGNDLFVTPFHRLSLGGKVPLMSGVELHANQLANLMNGNWLKRTEPRFEEAFIWVGGLMAGVILSLLKPLRGVLFAIALVVLLGACGVAWVHYDELWFPWSVVAFLQVPVALVWGSGAHFYVERYFRMKLDEEQRRLREVFARYVSPQMLERLTEEGFQMKLGGEKVWAAMVFTDIERFTDMCQKVKDPERIVDTLNDYFERTTEPIFDEDGVVIKFIGDAIFAAWGVPFADDAAADKSLRAAWKLFMNAKLLIDGEELRTRIGVHFGEVVAGNVGSARHIDYTLIGDDVNLAARLEGLNKMLGTSILFSGAVKERAGEAFRVRRVGRFLVKGRDEVTEVYELVGMAGGEAAPEWIGVYGQALEALEAGDREGALALFDRVDRVLRYDGDGPSRFFMRRLREGEAMVEGVVLMREK